MFEQLLGVPFRLAKSGLQFGVDGGSADPSVPVSFEAKLYRDTIPSSEVLNKLGALAIQNNPTELWVLGATADVKTQTADQLNALGRIHGISTLILDWQGSTPELAAVLVAAHQTVGAFLQRYVKPPELCKKAVAALNILSADTALTATAEEAVGQLRSASVAAPIALKGNREWLQETLKNRRLAKGRLGQGLSPLETTALPVLGRQCLVDALRASILVPPKDQLVAVLGDEGHGKSWLVMKCWADMPEPPLTVVLTPDAFGETTQDTDWDRFLIRKLLTQTGDVDTENSRQRWLRRFNRWRRIPDLTKARLLVIVDGINQRPGIQWGVVLDSLALHVKQLSGCTVVTSRTQFFESMVKPYLLTPAMIHPVPQWSETERDEILKSKGLTAASLQPVVAQSLRNPRLLGVALGLLSEHTLRSLDGLSVPQLLFEYLRTLDRDGSQHRSMAEFARLLQSHAQTVLQRVRAEVHEDRTVFEQLEPTAEGQFFRVLDDDPNRYTLREQGLTLALGFAIIDELRKAQRNERDLHEALMTVLEPVTALDRAAEAVMAALTIACLDNKVSDAIGSAVLSGFAHMQNPDGSKWSAFIELARRRVRVYCLAAEKVLLATDHAPNEDWIQEALLAVRLQPEVWCVIRPEVERWLCFWWPDEWVERRALPDQVLSDVDRQRHEAEFTQRKQALGPSERAYFDRLQPQRGSPFRLMELGLQLCAGQALSELVPALVCAKFSMALTPSLRLPDDDFTNLIRYNRRDWSPTRDLLLVQAAKLTAGDTSAVGRWTAVALWQATGDPNDAQMAHTLWEELTRDRDRGFSWRLVEDYCATDPCDPSSQRPDNIAVTAASYQKLGVGLLACHMGQTSEDRLFEEALPGLARFEPEVAICKHRELLASIPDRRGFPLRQAAWTAEKHSALLDKTMAAQILSLSNALSGDTAGLDADSIGPVQQALLLAVFPHLEPSDQMAGLLAVQDPSRIWLDVFRIAKLGNLQELHRMLRELAPSDPKVMVPLALVSGCGQQLPGLADLLPSLLNSPHQATRSVALQLANQTQDRSAFQVLAESGWSAAKVAQESRECISGSIALIHAAKLGIIPGTDILYRITPKTYGIAFRHLDGEAREQLAIRLDACIREASGLDTPLPPVEISLQITRNTELEYAWHSLHEPPKPPQTMRDFFTASSAGIDDFKIRQQRLRDAYEAFRSTLTLQTAVVVLEAFDLNGLQELVQTMPHLAEGWIRLMKLPTTPRQSALRNFGLLLASALTRQNGKLSEALDLYEAVVNKTSYVQIQYTTARLPLEAVTLWQAADDTKVNERRFARLDCCQNDHEIAQEAAAALYAGKSEILDDYIRERLGAPMPVDIARAITVAGFSDNKLLATEVLDAHEKSKGLLGDAAKACRFAMSRHEWAKHWFEIMQMADSPENFWTASVLFLKVVDGRFDALHRDRPTGGDVFNQWWWSVERQMKNRFDRWMEKRKKTLFGIHTPAAIYVTPPENKAY